MNVKTRPGLLGKIKRPGRCSHADTIKVQKKSNKKTQVVYFHEIKAETEQSYDGQNVLTLGVLWFKRVYPTVR